MSANALSALPAVTVAQTRVRLPASSDTSTVTVCVPAASAPVETVRFWPLMLAAPDTALPSTLTAIFAARAGYSPPSIVAVPVIEAEAPAETVSDVLFRRTAGASVLVTAWSAETTI